MNWETVIGLEVHAQLSTNTKLFSSASTRFGSEPNTQVDLVDLGLPGVLPVVNRDAFKKAITFGLAINADINQESTFDRKNYFYPDLPKGYQISQFDRPIISNGSVPIWWNNQEYIIELTRAHLEEDSGKSFHDNTSKKSNLDYNRSGAALIEIVTEPVLVHPEQAKIFMQRIKQIVNYINISNAEMEKGKLRCDANISLSKKGSGKFGVKTEIKNINSFRNVQKAIESEILRQNKILSDGDDVLQATLTWNNNKNVAEIMRIKENADDYRYFSDPDLPPVSIKESFIDNIKTSVPTLPFEYEKKWMNEYELSLNDCMILSSTKEIAEYFEKVVSLDVPPKKVSAWVTTELFRLFNASNSIFDSSKVSAKDLKNLIKLVDKNKITQNSGKEILKELFESDKNIDQILESGNFDAPELDINNIIETVLSNCENEVSRFKNGEEKLLGFFIGQINKKTRGKVNHELIITELKKKLKD